MLTQKQITEVEDIYIARKYRTINDNLFAFFIEHVYVVNLNQFLYIYFKWRLQRWTENTNSICQHELYELIIIDLKVSLIMFAKCFCFGPIAS